MSSLTGMKFKLHLSEPLNPAVHCLSPGSFEINGKKFDFVTSRVSAAGFSASTVNVKMEGFDESYAEENGVDDVTLTDIESGPFTSFYVYLGEKDEERVRIEKVSDISFEFGGGVLTYNAPSDGELEKSANDLIAEQIEEEFEK